MVSQAPGCDDLNVSLCCSAVQFESPVPPRNSQFFCSFQRAVSVLTKLLALNTTLPNFTLFGGAFCRSSTACVFQHLPSAQRALPVAVSVVNQGAALPGAKSTVGFQRPSSLAAATARAAIAELTPSPLAHSASWFWPMSSSVIGASVQPATAVRAKRERPTTLWICLNTVLPLL